jgi:trans-aconitate methyltransferase
MYKPRWLKQLRGWFVCPHRMAAVRRFCGGDDSVQLLDVGCGNHGPRQAKHYLPNCTYHGLADRPWNLDEEDDAAADKFYWLDLETAEALDEVPDAGYDVLVCSHVLEHLEDPYAVTPTLIRKLRTGGLLYIETPSPRSMKLPRAVPGWMGVRGCLNFWDDDTHKTLVDMERLCGILESHEIVVQRAGWIPLWRRLWLLPVYVVACVISKGFVPASVLWDVTGFCNTVIGVKK